MNREAELLDRIAALEARVAQLEARPQPTYAFGGAGNYFPWGTTTTAGPMVVGDNVSRETPKGPNGAGGPK